VLFRRPLLSAISSSASVGSVESLTSGFGVVAALLASTSEGAFETEAEVGGVNNISNASDGLSRAVLAASDSVMSGVGVAGRPDRESSEERDLWRLTMFGTKFRRYDACGNMRKGGGKEIELSDLQ
jgi:hypothetical protein